MRLLVLEDDRDLGHHLQEGLRLAGYAVNWVTRIEDAQSTLDTEAHDLLICSAQIGTTLTDAFIRKLRSSSALLPIIVTGERATPEQRVAALDAGADDFLPEPFSIDELGAVIRAQLRRSAGRATSQIECGSLTLDPAARAATLNGAPLELTAREFALLEKLAENAGRTVSKSRLEESLYAWNEEVESNAVEVHVHRLRKKLGPGFVRTVRGIGYVLDKPEAEPAPRAQPVAAVELTPTVDHGAGAADLADALNRVVQRIELIMEGQTAFTDDAARELRRPLSALRLQAELALQSRIKSQREQALHDVLQHVEQASHLLDVIVALAHIDQRARNEVQSTVNICKLCERCLAEIADSASKRDIDLSLRHGCEGEIWGRPDMIAMLIRSLAEAVILQSPPGGGVEVAVWQDESAVNLSVAEHPNTKRVSTTLLPRNVAALPRHRELTLALVKRIAHVHGASVQVGSEPHAVHAAVAFPRSERGRNFNWMI